MDDRDKEKIAEFWINEIKDFIFSLSIDDTLKRQVQNTLTSQLDLIKSGIVTDEIYGTISFGVQSTDKFNRECLSFIKYLYSLLPTKGINYFESAIDYSLNGNPLLSFIDNFIRFTVITNYSDIDISANINSERLQKHMNDYNAAEGFVRASLGGVLLCDLSQFSLHQDESGEKYMDFYNFHSRKNITRTKIGSLLIRSLIQRMLTDEILCDYSLGSVWVMKSNTTGKNFYKKMGFKFIGPNDEVVDYDYYDDYYKVKKEDYPNLTPVEFEAIRKKMNGNFCVVIPSEEKQDILNREFVYPYIEYLGNIYDYKTDFNQIKSKGGIK